MRILVCIGSSYGNIPAFSSQTPIADVDGRPVCVIGGCLVRPISLTKSNVRFPFTAIYAGP
jgi:hypothetical protein